MSILMNLARSFVVLSLSVCQSAKPSTKPFMKFLAVSGLLTRKDLLAMMTCWSHGIPAFGKSSIRLKPLLLAKRVKGGAMIVP
jgi:hypothetical protein